MQPIFSEFLALLSLHFCTIEERFSSVKELSADTAMLLLSFPTNKCVVFYGLHALDGAVACAHYFFFFLSFSWRGMWFEAV